MINRIFRVVVCFLLICCLVINISPIRAEAAGVEAVLVSTAFVPAPIVVSAVLFGLGVMVTAGAVAVFDKLVADCTAHLEDLAFVGTNGIDMYQRDVDGAVSYMVSQELVEAVREYLFEEEIIFEDLPVPEGNLSYNGHVFPQIPEDSSYGFATISKLDGAYYLALTKTRLYAYSGDPASSTCLLGDKNSHWYYKNYKLASGVWELASQSSVSYNTWAAEWTVLFCNYDLLAEDGTVFLAGSTPSSISNVSVIDGLTSGEIAPQDKTFTEGYSTWASGALTLPTLRDGEKTDAESAYIALGMPATYEDIQSMTQAQVQAGTGTYADSGTTADTVTATGLKGWLDTIRLSMVAGFSDVIAGITGFFTPSGNVEAYALDLKLLFPFCIPFDLFNLLKVLQADPVAPHFEFEFDFGSLGKFPVSVDFSEWNDLASLLRTLEMGLFIVGLAVGTRKLMGD